MAHPPLLDRCHRDKIGEPRIGTGKGPHSISMIVAWTLENSMTAATTKARTGGTPKAALWGAWGGLWVLLGVCVEGLEATMMAPMAETHVTLMVMTMGLLDVEVGMPGGMALLAGMALPKVLVPCLVLFLQGRILNEVVVK